MKKLNHYSIEEVLEAFDIQPIDNCQILDDWMNAKPTELSVVDKSLLKDLPSELQHNVRNWNEEELKMNFISLVFRMANLNVDKKMKIFYERPLTGTVQDYKISVITDCMVASPKNSGRPDAPYFFLQEFKRSKADDNDPEGQMLAAMILAQELNKDNKPLYGCWLQGRIWYFTVLNGTDYCVSKIYDASDAEDLLQIVFILRKLKDLILNR